MKQKKLLNVNKVPQKTFEELIDELENTRQIEQKEYVPRLCNALKRKNPLISGIEVRARVISATCENPKIGWKESSVRNFWPDWLKNPRKVESGKKGREAQLQIAQSNWGKTEVSQDELDKEEEQKPVRSMPKYEYDETHPETEESPFQALGEINLAISRLWTALTGNKNMPHMEDNVKKDLIIPTRDRFKDIANGSSKIERDFLFNWLTWLDMLINDRINVLEKSDKTAYDRE